MAHELRQSVGVAEHRPAALAAGFDGTRDADVAAGLGEEVEDAVRGEGGETRKGDGGGEEDWDVAGDVGGGPELS